MSKIRSGFSRRRFVTTTMLATGALGVSGLFRTGIVQGEDLPPVDESEATAQALKYVHDATKADQAARGGDDRFCNNCQFYTGNQGSEWGPCSLFPAKSVAAKGWCTAWAPKSG